MTSRKASCSSCGITTHENDINMTDYEIDLCISCELKHLRGKVSEHEATLIEKIGGLELQKQHLNNKELSFGLSQINAQIQILFEIGSSYGLHSSYLERQVKLWHTSMNLKKKTV